MPKFKSISKYICIGIIAVSVLAGCGSDGNQTETGTHDTKPDSVETEDRETADVGAEADTTKPEVPEIEEVDYPFASDQERWRLVLCADEEDEAASSYRFGLYDEADDLVQEFPCGLDAEEYTFRFDRWLYNQWASLAVFPADAQTSHADGLLFVWDYDEQRFDEEPIVIPWYDQVNSSDYTFTVTETDEQGNTETRSIYCLDREIRQPVELRIWTLSWEEEQSKGAAGVLCIRDCVEQAELFNGKVEWKSPGRLVNEEYYQDLFLKDLHRPGNPIAYAIIPTAKYVTGGEDDRHLENIDYESREELLADCGFQDAEPFYQYYDNFGNTEMELYLDESAGKGCGFIYSHGFDYDLNKVIWDCSGFIFEGIGVTEWEDDTFSLLTWEGTDARECEDVTQVIYDYTDNGELSFYEVRGITEYTRMCWEEGIEREDDPFISIDWVYRGDGTLYRKYYSHDSLSFSTTGQTQWVYYDESGRPSYGHEYITHGSFNYYYIYEGDNTIPKYCLSLDLDGGYFIPMMYVYR